MKGVMLKPAHVTLGEWRAIYQGADAVLDDRCAAADRKERGGGRSDCGARRAGLWHQHRLRQARERADRCRGPCDVAAQHRAVALPPASASR